MSAAEKEQIRLKALAASMAAAEKRQQSQPAESYMGAVQQQDLLERLEALEAKGELRPAEKQALADLRGASAANTETIGETGASYRGFLQGLSLRQADEIAGLFGGDKEGIRDRNDAAREAFPEAYGRGELGGGLTTAALTGIATAPISGGATLLGTAGRGAAIGGTEGFIFGSGGAEGVEDKIEEGLKYGGTGAALGFGAPYVVAGGGALVRGADDIIRGATNTGNQGRANRTVMAALNRAGLSVDDVADDVARAAAAGQPEFRAMDAMGLPGQRLASGVARSGGDGAEEIAAYLRSRQASQPDRIAAMLDDALGTRGTTAATTRETIRGNRKAVADTLFAQAAEDAAPVDVRPTVALLDETIEKMSGSGIKPPKVVKEFQKLRARLAGTTPDGDPTTLSDYESTLALWREVRDDVTKHFKAGDGALGEALKPIRDSLQASLEESSDLYRFATDNYRIGSSVLDAVDTGEDLARQAGRTEDSLRTIRGLSDQERRAAASGFSSRLQAEIASNRAQAPNAARVLNSEKRLAEAMEFADDPALLAERQARENTMFDTFNRATGGSLTADNLQDIAGTGPLADVAAGARDAVLGNPVGATANATRAVGRLATGQNEATRQMIADILMSPDPRAALEQAARQAGSAETRKRIIEAVTRALGRDLLAE